MQCPECNASRLRLSKFRTGDVGRLLLLQYPLRCRECRARFYVLLPHAVRLARSHSHEHRQPASR
ncbi:MAG: hypothetical protein IRZ03_17930 [Acidobacterium ailaaui]|jgi:hypothetical protein|nr:hypothetical protein [Pseudacidobacterium ailaaui]